MLAGFGDKVDDDLKRRVRENARSLLARLPRERAICGMDVGPEPKLLELHTITAKREAARIAGAKTAGAGKRRNPKKQRSV